jgi:pimeloyl-ACP methyl ester carboxylesterase
MGDLRSVYRFLAPELESAGFRVATMDLRGHGEGDATFVAYDDSAAATDVLALVGHLGGRAIVIGNSMGAGAAAYAAAERPEQIGGLVLIGPFVRNTPVSPLAALAFRLALLWPWGRAARRAYYASLYRSRRPPDLRRHQAEIDASLRRPGHWRAFVATTRTSHAPVEARLGKVRAPVLVVMGERDPDFRDPRGEAEAIARLLRAEVLMVPGAGHYPQAECPEIVTPAVVDFARRVSGNVRGALQEWLSAYIHAWSTDDPEEIGALFTDDARYFTAPYREPLAGREAIVAWWTAQRESTLHWAFEHKTIACEGPLYVLQAKTTYAADESAPPAKTEVFHNLWLVTLSEDGRAKEFVEYWMLEE